MINIKMIPVGELEANCYFVVCGDEAIVIDPGAPSKKLDSLIEAFGAKRLKYILLTHGHFDHIGYTAALKKKYPHTKIVIGEKDNSFTANPTLNLSLFFGDYYLPKGCYFIDGKDKQLFLFVLTVPTAEELRYEAILEHMKRADQH